MPPITTTETVVGKEKKILLSHGSGGRLSQELVKSFSPRFSNEILNRMDDSAVFDLSGRLAFTTDSYVVSPIFFPGGDIGKLAVCGTVNDLAMCGAQAMYISLAFIVEEGLTLDELDRVAASIQKAAEEAGVNVVTGDTKVVNRGNADKLFINTSGIGTIDKDLTISGCLAMPGDIVLLSGSVGDHGMAVMSKREGLQFGIEIESDCAPLNRMVEEMLAASKNIHVLRDPTRGGLATTLNEIASQSGVSVRLEEEAIPVRPPVRAACDFLGLDPLYVANEGKLVAFVAPEDAGRVLEAMRANRYGRDSAVVGEVAAENPGRVTMKTPLGAWRIVDMLSGELLPRIC